MRQRMQYALCLAKPLMLFSVPVRRASAGTAPGASVRAAAVLRARARGAAAPARAARRAPAPAAPAAPPAPAADRGQRQRQRESNPTSNIIVQQSEVESSSLQRLPYLMYQTVVVGYDLIPLLLAGFR